MTLDEAAQRLGVHYMTVYRYVRTGRLPAHTVGGRWRVYADDLEVLERRNAHGRSRRGTRTADPAAGEEVSAETRVQRLAERLVAGDGPGSWAVIESALLNMRPSDIYLELVGPALRLIGERWADGELSIGDEHRATALAIGMIGRLGPLFSRPGRHRPGWVMLAGAQGDHHQIPVLMVGDLLRGAGFNVVQLGADVPADNLVAMAAAPDLLAIGLSASTDESSGQAGVAIGKLRKSGVKVPVLLGGPAVTDESTALALGADAWAADAVSAVAVVERWAEERNGK